MTGTPTSPSGEVGCVVDRDYWGFGRGPVLPHCPVPLPFGNAERTLLIEAQEWIRPFAGSIKPFQLLFRIAKLSLPLIDQYVRFSGCIKNPWIVCRGQCVAAVDEIHHVGEPLSLRSAPVELMSLFRVNPLRATTSAPLLTLRVPVRLNPSVRRPLLSTANRLLTG